MELRRISKWILIAGTLLIWAVKFGVRPFYEGNESFQFFLGVAPNLFGSFLIPFGAYWLFSGRDFFVARIFRIHTMTHLLHVCLLGFSLLIFNEYLQLIPVFGRTFDYFDILFSAIGLTVSYFVFGRMVVRKLGLTT
jgi:hypothetical protein